jgi:hypothetical protein
MGTPNEVNGRRKNTRRSYLIDRSFQLKVAAWIALDVFAVTFLCGVVMLIVLEPQVRARVLNPVSAGLAGSMVTLLGFAAGFGLLAAGAFAAWSVLITHRLVGPIGVVARGLEQVSRGEFPRFRPLRKKDEFREFYAAYWRMVHALRARKQADLAVYAEIIEAANRAAASAHGPARDALASILESIRPLHEAAAQACSKAAAPDAAPAASTQPDASPHDAEMTF